MECSTTHDHGVQFYQGDVFLCDVVTGFLDAGLRADEPLVVIATEAHRAMFCRGLQDRGLDVERARASGRFTLLDARATLATFMVDGMPDWDRFRSRVGGVIAECTADGRATRVRAYGEMVDLLWRDGNHRAAIRLEQLWNELAKTHSFSLLCAYLMDNFFKEDHTGEFKHVCGVHTQVRPTEDYIHAPDPEARFRAVALLQQRAQALEDEVKQRHQLEVELRQALDREQAAHRAKDEFLAMLGHELRNPLSPILTSLELMRLRLGDLALRERETIDNQVRLLVRLVDDLLDAARIDRGKIALELELLELSDVVAEAIETAAPLIARKGHRVETSVPGHGLGVEGDRQRLTQVVTNLLTNAAKYTKPDGTIRIAAERSDGHCILRIADNGIGIAAELLPRVFEAFVQGERGLDRGEGGLGMGLAIASKLISLHQGTLSVRSDGPNRGSEFTVSLPHVPHTRRVSEVIPKVLSELQANALRVLVVDDNADAAELIGEAVKLIGHDVAVAYDSTEALATLSKFQADVALLDIGLPDMNGYELAQRIRQHASGSRMYLLALTGYGEESHRTRSREAGFDEHLVKPIDIQSLREVLSRVRRGPSALTV